MISGLYRAAYAMDGAALRHETAADNLAHAHQPGFRRRVVGQTTFDAVIEPQRGSAGSQADRAKTHRDALHVDFQSGPLQQTGRPLDVALQGDGFFVVQGTDGPMYTRNGGFHVNQDGLLVTVDQLPVLGNGGPITLPNNASSEAVMISATGEVTVDGDAIGQLQLAAFEDQSVLQPAGVSLFAAPPGVTPQEADVQIVQGFLEQSNVSAIDELVTIMVGSRHYEAARKAMNAMEESLQKRVGI